MNPLILIAIGGVALMAMAGGKKKKPATKAGKEIEGEKSADPGREGIEDGYRPWEEEGSEQPPTTGGDAAKDEVRKNLAEKHLPNGYDIPDGFGDNDAWVSDDCKAYAIGRNFFASHIDNAKQIYLDILNVFLSPEYEEGNPGLYDLAVFSHPEEWDARTLVEYDVQAGYDTPGLVWARSRLPADCAQLVPAAKDYSTGQWKDYNDAWQTFAQTHPALADFVTKMAQFADEQMGDIWENMGFGEGGETLLSEAPYPFYLADEEFTAMEGYSLRTAIRQVLQELPDVSVGDVTDEVYARLYSNTGTPELDICPEVIQPNNPDHDYCKALWLVIRDWAQLYADAE